LSKSLVRRGRPLKLPTEELFVDAYVLIHDLILSGAIQIPRRPGLPPACTDAELLAISEVRHLRGRRSESGLLAEVARDWGRLFPVLPHQSEADRRTRWLWGAFERLRVMTAARLPEATTSRSMPARCRWWRTAVFAMVRRSWLGLARSRRNRGPQWPAALDNRTRGRVRLFLLKCKWLRERSTISRLCAGAQRGWSAVVRVR
jgi:hypothetical protein